MVNSSSSSRRHRARRRDVQVDFIVNTQIDGRLPGGNSSAPCAREGRLPLHHAYFPDRPDKRAQRLFGPMTADKSTSRAAWIGDLNRRSRRRFPL
jgi:hypothetical protein